MNCSVISFPSGGKGRSSSIPSVCSSGKVTGTSRVSEHPEALLKALDAPECRLSCSPR